MTKSLGFWRSWALVVGTILFALFAIIGSGVEVVGYGLLLLAAGLPVYYGVTRRTS